MHTHAREFTENSKTKSAKSARSATTPDGEVITVAGPDLWAAVRRVRALGGVVLGYAADGPRYRLRVMLPDGETLAEAMEQHAKP
jgi:hypothetical protein